MDYGRELEFGYFLVPEAADPARSLQIASLVDRLGYDLIGIQDHPYQPRFFDTLALIGWILSRTDRVRVFADVHEPALLATFMEDVAPAVRERVAAARGRSV